MKKIKNKKRVLPIVLAVVLLMTLFTIGASALTPEEVGLCDCVLGQKLEYNREECEQFIGDSNTVTIVCDECENRYQIYDQYMTTLEHFPDYDLMTYWLDVPGDEIALCWEVSLEGVGQDGTENSSGISITVLPPASSEGDSMVGSMVGTVTTGIGGILVGIGSAIVGFFDTTVLNADGTGLSTFAIWALAFLGIAFALGVVKFITNIVRK